MNGKLVASFGVERHHRFRRRGSLAANKPVEFTVHSRSDSLARRTTDGVAPNGHCVLGRGCRLMGGSPGRLGDRDRRRQPPETEAVISVCVGLCSHAQHTAGCVAFGTGTDHRWSGSSPRRRCRMGPPRWDLKWRAAWPGSASSSSESDKTIKRTPTSTSTCRSGNSRFARLRQLPWGGTTRSAITPGSRGGI